MDPKQLLQNIDSNGLVGKMLGGMATKNFAAGLVSGGLATALLGGKLKVGDTAETLVKAGGMAALGALAYKAYGNYKQQQASGGQASVVTAVKGGAQDLMGQASGLLSGLMAQQQPPVAAAPAAIAAPVAPPANPDLALAVIRAMIGAAKADGKVDAAESEKILGQLESDGVTAQEKMLLMQEMANTPDISTIAAAAKTPQDAAQIYLAAVLVCDSQCANEQKYLGDLASAMKLEPAFTAGLQQELLAISAQRAA